MHTCVQVWINLLDKICHYVHSISVDESNGRALFKAIEPHLKLAMSSIYLHEVSSNQWQRAQANDDDGVVRLTGVSL